MTKDLSDVKENQQVDTASSDIGRRSAHGGLIMLGSNVLILVLMVGTTMVLARVLTPGDFGLVAMGTLLIGLAEPIRLFGLPSAIVHQSDLQQGHLIELFWLNFKLNTLLAAIMGASAPLIAWFFDQPRLNAIILVLATGFLIRGLANIQLGLLRRQMRFGLVAFVKAAALVVGAVVGVAWALLTQSYWALVFQQLATSLSEPVLFWWVCRWRPTRLSGNWKRRQSLVRAMVVYGKNSTLTSLVHSAGVQMDRVLLGRYVGVDQLGLYQNALRWATVPALQMLDPLKTIAVSGFSRLRHDPERYRAYARRAFTVAITLTLPTFVFLCIEAREFVLLLLGSQWIGAVPLFQILVMAMLFTTTERVSKWIYLSEGETTRGLRWQLFSTSSLVVCMVAGLPWGAIGVAAGFCMAKLLLAYPTLWFCLRTSPLQNSDFWNMTLRPGVATAGATAVLFFLRSAEVPLPDLLPLRLVFEATAFGVVFAGVWLATPGGLETTLELLKMLKAAPAGKKARQ